MSEEDDNGEKAGKGDKAGKGAKADKDEKTDKASNEDVESKQEEPKGRAAPHWGMKVLRVFLFASLGTFIAAFLFADSIPNGLRVEFDLLASVKLGLIAGAIAALLRAVAPILPLFADD